ncbi:MAG: hypothetical protein J6B07_04845, partial [Opitutales bacterium]|nr:hypothetical protein [Opitutales bacterium]
NGLPFNPNDMRLKDLPTDINGTTVDNKPGKPYFASEFVEYLETGKSLDSEANLARHIKRFFKP